MTEHSDPFAGPTTTLEVERVFAASPERLYAAWTEAAPFAAWFGPHAFTLPIELVSIDARPGGHQRFTMVHRDDPSITSPVDAVFDQLDPPRRIVGRQSVGPIVMTLEVDLEPVDETHTRMRIRQHPHPEGLLEDAKAGWAESAEKLDAAIERGDV